MTSAYDIANYFLAKDADHTVFNKKVISRNGRNFYEGNARLNKYLHISQNLYIAKTGEKLFDEDLYAFDNGGVIPTIQKNYSVLLNRSKKFNLDKEKTDFLDRVYYILKNADIDELIEASHEDSAWKEKSNNYYLDKEQMNSLGHADEYKKQYSDMLKVMDSLTL